MTKKHFTAIAHIIDSVQVGSGIEAERLRKQVARDMADYFQTVNPNFDRQRFLIAASAA